MDDVFITYSTGLFKQPLITPCRAFTMPDPLRLPDRLLKTSDI